MKNNRIIYNLMKKVITILTVIMSVFAMPSVAQEQPQIHYDGEILSVGTSRGYSSYPFYLSGYEGISWKYNTSELIFRPMTEGLYIGTSGNSLHFYNSDTQVYNMIRCSNFYIVSDGRLKEDIAPIENATEIIGSFAGEATSESTVRKAKKAGVTESIDNPLLESIRSRYPELVETGLNGEPLVNYVELVPLLVKSLQELQAVVSDQNKLLQTLV